MKNICPKFDKYVKTGNVGVTKCDCSSNLKTPQKSKCQRNTQQNKNSYVWKNSIKSLRSTLQAQYQKITGEIIKLKSA